MIAASLGFAAASPSGGMGEQSKVLRQPEYVLRYPGTMRVRLGTMNGTKVIRLDGPDGSMEFVIQRNLNPAHLSIAQWYESLARRPMNSAERRVDLAGREMVQRNDGADAETIFVPVVGKDVLTILIRPANQSARGRLERIIETMQFPM